MTERTQWTDPAINREFERVYKSINGTPQKMVRLEEAMKTLSIVVQDLREDHEKDMAEIKAELSGSKWSRTQTIGALGVLTSFIAAGAAVAAVIFG